MARPREFQRLEMLIALERGGEDETWREASDRFRTGMRSLVEGALFEIFRDAGENLARQVAAEGVDFAEILGVESSRDDVLAAIRAVDADGDARISWAEFRRAAIGEAEEDAELGARRVVRPVPDGLVGGPRDHGQVAPREPALEHLHVVESLRRPLKVALLERVLRDTEADQLAVLHVV